MEQGFATVALVIGALVKEQRKIPALRRAPFLLARVHLESSESVKGGSKAL